MERSKIRALVFFAIVLLMSMQLTNVWAQPFADPIGDVFDRQGRLVTAESYLDIVEVELVRSGITYNARMKMNSPLPSSLDDPTIFLDWDMLVDIDQNRETHPWGPWSLLDNGLGIDLLIRLMLGPSGRGYRAEVFNMTNRKGVNIDFRVDGAALELKFDDNSLGVAPKAFDFTFSARKYGDYGRSGAEFALDKAPNQGYFTFAVDKMALITFTTATFTFILKQRYEGPMTDAHLHPVTRSVSKILQIMDVLRKAGYDKAIFLDREGALTAYAQRRDEIIPAFEPGHMNLTRTVQEVEDALRLGFKWIGEACLRHRRGIGTTPADYTTALQIYDLCAKYQVPIMIHQDSTDFKGAYKELEKAFAYNPRCIFVFHGGHFDTNDLSMSEMERMLQTYPNVYIEIGGCLETAITQEFLGYTRDDRFSYTDGRIREKWRTFFEKYQDRIINGNDFFTESVFTVEQVRLRNDYFRKLFGQVSHNAAEKISYRNVEDLIARKAVLMSLDISSTTIMLGEKLKCTVRLVNMAGEPIKNTNVSLHLDPSSGTPIPIGQSATNMSGQAELICQVPTNLPTSYIGSSQILVSYEGSLQYAPRWQRRDVQITAPRVTTPTTTQTRTYTTTSPTPPGDIVKESTSLILLVSVVLISAALLAIRHWSKKSARSSHQESC